MTAATSPTAQPVYKIKGVTKWTRVDAPVEEVSYTAIVQGVEMRVALKAAKRAWVYHILPSTNVDKRTVSRVLGVFTETLCKAVGEHGSGEDGKAACDAAIATIMA